MTDTRDAFTLPETCPDWGFTPTEQLPPDKQTARRARIEAFKALQRERRKARKAKQATRTPLPPVYDDVWAQGVRWLDEEAP